jgi:hypothetical protein
MKSIKYILIILFLNTLFISCTNTDDEDLQLMQKNQSYFSADTGNDPIPPPPPPPPPPIG